MFKKVRALQEAINRIGLGGAVLRLTAPRMLSLPGPSTADNTVHEQFQAVIDHAGLIGVARDLFVSGFYTEAAEAAYKYLDEQVRKLTGEELSGTKLMERVFSPNEPIIELNGLSSQVHKDEQAGYHRIFAGSMLGIRNPCAHQNGWIDDPKQALEVVVLCQHLLKKVEASQAVKRRACAYSPAST